MLGREGHQPALDGSGALPEHCAFDQLPCLIDGKYLLQERIGEGTTGEVFRALHLGLKRQVAVKLLKTDRSESDAGERFAREAEALGRLRHPNLVEVMDFGTDPATGARFLVMELVQGPSLATVCLSRGALPPAEALPLLSAIAEALDTAHSLGVLHRDLKTHNVVLARRAGASPVVKVLDFGLAQVLDRRSSRRRQKSGEVPWPARVEPPGQSPRLSATGALLGTPHYLAPEVIQGQSASRASDVYSFGVMAYELLTGEVPFQGNLAEVLRGHLHDAPPLPTHPLLRTAAVSSALFAPLAKDPTERPATAASAVAAIHRALQQASYHQWFRRQASLRFAWAGLLTVAAMASVLTLAPQGAKPLERWTYDWRLRSAPGRAADPRILLVTLESSSTAGAPLLGERADEVAMGLEQLFAAGAASVAIDLELPRRWSKSGLFAAAIVRHADRLTLAAASNDGRTRGTEAVSGLATAALGLDRVLDLFGLTNTAEDSDGINRRGAVSFRDLEGNERLSFAAHAVTRFGATGSTTTTQPEDSSSYWIDHRINAAGYNVLPLRELEPWLREHPDAVQGRLVLLGVTDPFESEDLHQVPQRMTATGYVCGLTLQALQIDTLLAGRSLRDMAASYWCVPGGFAATVLAASLLLWRRQRWVLVAAAALGTMYLVAAWWLFHTRGWVVPVTPLLLITALALTFAWTLRYFLPRPPLTENER